MQAKRRSHMGTCTDLSKQLADVKLYQLFSPCVRECWLTLGTICRALFLPPPRHRSLICWKALRTAVTQSRLDFWKSWRDRRSMRWQFPTGDTWRGCSGKNCQKDQKMTVVIGPAGQHLICFPRSSDTSASALSSRQACQHVSAEANTLHSSGQAAAVSPGQAGMSHQTEHSALHEASDWTWSSKRIWSMPQRERQAARVVRV